MCAPQKLYEDESSSYSFFVSYKLFPSLLKLYSLQHRKTMENGARVIKGFILSIPQSVSRLWHGAGQLESQQLPPPTMNQEEDLVNMFHARQEMEWQKTLISICFTSGLEIALHFHQPTHSKLDSLHLVCILVAIIFSCLFVSHFINPTKFPRTSKVLGEVAVFLAATVFFITISISFPPRVKWANWIIYSISLLVIAICNFYF
ncbi:hypothetical protein NC651_036291 [Populus alba x Populus x berolinensis]|nr:hypothetical protein NC651_036291 [Populus alba x Populus x berolinensis]